MPDKHALPHYVTALYGDTFPACLECVDGVRFELAVVAGYIGAHPLFIRPRNK